MEIEVLVFECNARFFGVRASDVSEVLRVVALTPLPRAPEIAMGMVNLRGSMLPVLNTKRLLGLEDSELHYRDHMVVVAACGIQLALHVDRAVDLMSVQADAVEAAAEGPEREHEIDGRLVDMIAKTHLGIVQVIDPNRLLSESDTRALVALVTSSTATESPT